MTIDLDHIITKTAGASKKIASKAADAATHIVDSTKTSIERAGLRDQIKEKYRSIGELTYKTYGGGTDNTAMVKRLCADLDALNEKLESLAG
jgi:ABC-type tungstate transport system permease subunit